MSFEAVNGKSAVVVVLLGLMAFVERTHCVNEEHRKMLSDCVTEAGASPDVILKAFKEGNFPDDNKVKCSLLCIHKKMGYSDDTGIVDPKKFIETVGSKIGGDKAAKIMAVCKDNKGDTPCDAAFNLSKCLAPQFKSLGLHSQVE